MKKFVVSFLLFSFYSVGLYGILLFTYSYLAPNKFGGNVFKYNTSFDYSKSRLREADTVKNVDLLIMGSSHAYRGYDVRAFKAKGMKAFNLGTSAQTLIQTNYLLDKYVDKLKPKMVIIDIYPIMLNTDGVESLLQLLAILKIDKKLKDMAFEANDLRAYNTLFYYSVLNKIGLSRNLMNDEPDDKNKYISGGYVENRSSARASKDGSEGGSDRSKQVELIFSLKQQEMLKGMINKLKARKIPYIIFQSPISKRMYQSFSNNKEIDVKLSAYGPYYNYNEVRFLDDSCFIDNNHLNYNGVKIYDKFVMDKINALR